MVSVIPLTKGHKTLVDDGDFEWLSQYRWSALSRPDGSVHAITRVRVSDMGRKGGWKTFYMHRMITNASAGKVVDHVDRNPLNNQRSNLRVCAQRDNSRNQSGSTTGRKSSKYKGVVLAKWNVNPKWVAAIQVDRKRIYLGYFAN